MAYRVEQNKPLVERIDRFAGNVEGLRTILLDRPSNASNQEITDWLISAQEYQIALTHLIRDTYSHLTRKPIRKGVPVDTQDVLP